MADGMAQGGLGHYSATLPQGRPNVRADRSIERIAARGAVERTPAPSREPRSATAPRS